MLRGIGPQPNDQNHLLHLVDEPLAVSGSQQFSFQPLLLL